MKKIKTLLQCPEHNCGELYSTYAAMKDHYAIDHPGEWCPLDPHCYGENLHPILAKANALCVKKSEDYNGPDDNDPSKAEYFPYGHQSYLHMLHTKFKRLEQVMLAEADPNFESGLDSILDLINYASFYGAYLEAQDDV